MESVSAKHPKSKRKNVRPAMTLNEVNDDLATAVKTFKVVAVIPVHGRLPLLPLTIRRLYKRNGVDVVICVGDGIAEKAICKEAGAKWVSYQNLPLGAKWNAGFMAAKEYNPDAVLYVGSSDWLSDNWLTAMEPLVNQHQMVGVPGCYFGDIGYEVRLVYWPGYQGTRADETIGIGRMLSKKLLDAIDWKPFHDDKSSSLDRSMKEKAAKVGVQDYFVHRNDIMALSISTNQWENKHKFIHHWTNMMPSQKIKEPVPFLMSHFPEVFQIFEACSHTSARA